MILLKNLGTKQYKEGKPNVKFGLFRCEVCDRVVEKRLYHGKRDKSCGCSSHIRNEESRKKISNSLKGRKLSADVKKKVSSGVKRYRKENPSFQHGTRHPNYVDGRSYHPLYATYRGMMSRCYNINSDNYSLYGERGVKVCERWKTSFWFFVEDINNLGWFKGMRLHRKDNSLIYGPDTVICVTISEHNRIHHCK